MNYAGVQGLLPVTILDLIYSFEGLKSGGWITVGSNSGKWQSGGWDTVKYTSARGRNNKAWRDAMPNGVCDGSDFFFGWYFIYFS